MCARVAIAKRVALVVVCLAVITPVCHVPGLCDGTSETITDVIVGRGNKGPYGLSYSNFDANTVQVVVNGMTLRRDDKYSVDATNGVISFTSTVLTDTIVRVTYSTIAGKSKRNSSGTKLPVTLNVFQRKDASLQVTGIYAEDASQSTSSDTGRTVVGLGGEKTWGSSKVTTQFYTSQRNSETSSSESGTWDKSAFKVGTENTFGRFKFSGSLLQAGSDFAGGTDTGLGVGKRSSDFALSFSPGSNLTATAKLQQNSDTSNKSSVLEQSVVASVGNGSKLALTHSLSETGTSTAGSEKTVDATGIKLNTKLNADTTAVVTAGVSTTTDSSDTETVVTQGAQVQSKIASGQVSLTQKESEADGKEQSYAVSGQVKPIDTLSLQAAVQGTDSAQSGASSKTDLKVQFDPDKKMQIQARLQTDTASTTQQYQRDVSVVSKPLDYAKVTASFSQKGANETDDVTKQAKLEVTPFSHTQLSAGVKCTESGVSAMTVTDYAAKTAPVKFVTFSGNLRQRQSADQDAQDSAALEVALKPVDYLAFTGSYQTNPEDSNGDVQTYNATSVGLKAKFGSVGVTTAYQSKNEYISQQTSDEGKLALELPCFAGGKLTTGVTIARLMDSSMTSSSKYELGYVRNMSSAFSFSLTGYYTRYLKDRTVVPDQTEYSAEASIGLKF